MTEYINKDNPVYVSYASNSKTRYSCANHEPKSPKNVNRKDIVDKVIEACKLANVFCKIDEEVVKGGNITTFENEIGNAKYVIIVLSDKYFLSPHCMYEWDMIHAKTDGKEIRYIRFNEEIMVKKDGDGKITCSKAFDFTGKDKNYYDDYIKPSWDLWSQQNSRTAGDVYRYACEHSLFEKSFHLFKEKVSNHCILDTSDWKTPFVIISGLKDKILHKADSVYQISKNTVTKENNSLQLNEKTVSEFLLSKSILLVGDSVFHHNDTPLGDYILNRFLSDVNKTEEWNDKKKWEGDKLFGFREWNRCLGDEKRDDKVCSKLDALINEVQGDYSTFVENYVKSNGEIENDNLCPIKFIKFQNFIKNSNFDVIISVGYCSAIIKDIIERIKGKVIIKTLSGETKDSIAKKNNTEIKKDTDIYFYDFMSVPTPLFTPKDITEMVVNALYQFKEDKHQVFNNRRVLALGTELPGWALRHIWFALTNGYFRFFKRDFPNSIVVNKDVDPKTKQFIGTPFIISDFTDSFIEKWTEYAIKSMKHFDIDEKKKNVYIFFFDKEYENFCSIYNNYLQRLEKNNDSLHFVWKLPEMKLMDKDRIAKITKCIIIYDGYNIPDIPTIRSIYSNELQKVCYGKNILFIHNSSFDKDEVINENSLFRSELLANATFQCKDNLKLLNNELTEFLTDKQIGNG